MDSPNQNPLQKHFRQPVIYIEPLSKGRFWPDGAIELPVTGELPIYPMTLKDEIVLKTPDALMNGAGVVETIQSCCPNIKNAWEMPSIDLDQLIIAIRIATFGENMEITATCPNTECNEENTFQINLHNVLAGLSSPDYNTPVEFPDFKIYLKPLKYFDLNRRNKIEFEEQQMLKAIQQLTSDPDNTDEAQAGFNKHLDRILSLNFESIASSTNKIILNDGTVVTDYDYILDFYKNSGGVVTKRIQSISNEFANQLKVKPFEVTCPHCETEHRIDFTFDYANFFG